MSESAHDSSPEMIEPAVVPPRDGRIVILTGAGISKESGLDTFRDADGIWSKVRIEDVATYEAFVKDPRRVHAFYNMRRALNKTRKILPNFAHAALSHLEAAWPGEVLIVTRRAAGYTTKFDMYKYENLASDVTVLIKGTNEKGSMPSAWVRERPNGRVFYLGFGHNEEFENKDYLQMIGDGVIWTAKKRGADYRR